MQGLLDSVGRALNWKRVANWWEGCKYHRNWLGAGGSHASQWPCPASPPLTGVCVYLPLVSLASKGRTGSSCCLATARAVACC